MSPYLAFYSDNFSTIKAKNKELSTAEICKQIGAKWNNLSEKAKQPFIKIS